MQKRARQRAVASLLGVALDRAAAVPRDFGQRPAERGVGDAAAAQALPRKVEYDAFDDRYVTFLLTEIIHVVQARWSISDDPGRWGICGGSSGGNCAFTAAWMRPDKFRRVICSVSSFTQMPGGNPYPELIPTVPCKPLRIFMQRAHGDLQWNEPENDWLSNNLRVAAALAKPATTSGSC